MIQPFGGRRRTEWRMLTACNHCPGRSSEMLLEAEFRSIFAPRGDVAIWRPRRQEPFHFHATIPGPRMIGCTWFAAVQEYPEIRWCACFTLAALSVITVTEPIPAAPAVSRDFNGPDTAWQLLNTSIPAKLAAHDLLPTGAPDGSGFERLIAAGPAGQSVMLQCPMTPLAAVDELQASLWVKASHPGVQLALRVVLPRSQLPRSDATATTMVRGTATNHPGHWQQLIVSDVPKLLAAQVRVMRTTAGATIDPREAFVDAVVLIVPGDPNGVDVATDALKVEGVMSPSQSVTRIASQAPNGSASAKIGVGNLASNGNRAGESNTHLSTAPSTQHIRLQGSTMLVDGKLFLPRIIQWRGEPLQFLSDCGFNVVQLPAHRPPTRRPKLSGWLCGLFARRHRSTKSRSTVWDMRAIEF